MAETGFKCMFGGLNPFLLYQGFLNSVIQSYRCCMKKEMTCVQKIGEILGYINYNSGFLRAFL